MSEKSVLNKQCAASSINICSELAIRAQLFANLFVLITNFCYGLNGLNELNPVLINAALLNPSLISNENYIN